MQGRIPEPYPENLTIFETMRAEADGRIVLWAHHLARLRRGCAAVGFFLDEDRVQAALAGLPRGKVMRARLAVEASGHVILAHAPLPPNPSSWRVRLATQRLDAADPWLSIKSSHRSVYEAARDDLPPGIDEALLLNTDGHLCEGSITSLFLCRDGVLLTPALSCGLLPGVLRAELLARRIAQEAVLRPEDLLSGQLYCGNALRGLIPARLA
ncbi:MAG: hypothetical protein FJX25_14695 [Alphaproteobacteria bacterium]|nr:hypothetical protein [Alphaproteobacteria bacterium]